MNFRHNTINILFVSFLVLFSSIATSKETGHFKPTAVDSSPPEYRWISYMSSGPADTSILDDSPDGVRGLFYRLAFISNDDAFSRPTMRIDEFVYGDAGCCWIIKKSWNVDFNKLEKSGVQMPPPERSGIDSVIWLDSRVVKIIYGESECTISSIGEANILAKCKLKSKK
jgi:hypothetical protein